MNIARSTLKHGNILPDLETFLASLDTKYDYSADYNKGPIRANYQRSFREALEAISELADSLALAEHIKFHPPQKGEKSTDRLNEAEIIWRRHLKHAQSEMHSYHDDLVDILNCLYPKDRSAKLLRVFKKKVADSKKVFAAPINKAKHNQRAYNFIVIEGFSCNIPGYFMTSAAHGKGQVEEIDQDINPNNYPRSLYRETTLYLYFVYTMAKVAYKLSQKIVSEVHGTNVAIGHRPFSNWWLEQTAVKVINLPREMFAVETYKHFPEIKLISDDKKKQLSMIGKPSTPIGCRKNGRVVVRYEAGFDIESGHSHVTLPTTDLMT